MSYIIGIDTGGTFTNVAIIGEDGVVFIGKALSTPPQFEKGILNALQVAAERGGTTMRHVLKETIKLGYGTTIATNALWTRTGEKVGFETTRK